MPGTGDDFATGGYIRFVKLVAVMFDAAIDLSGNIPGSANITEEYSAYISEVKRERPAEHQMFDERKAEFKVVQNIARSHLVVIADTPKRRHKPGKIDIADIYQNPAAVIVETRIEPVHHAAEEKTLGIVSHGNSVVQTKGESVIITKDEIVAPIGRECIKLDIIITVVAQPGTPSEVSPPPASVRRRCWPAPD